MPLIRKIFICDLNKKMAGDIISKTGLIASPQKRLPRFVNKNVSNKIIRYVNLKF